MAVFGSSPPGTVVEVTTTLVFATSVAVKPFALPLAVAVLVVVSLRVVLAVYIHFSVG